MRPAARVQPELRRAAAKKWGMYSSSGEGLQELEDILASAKKGGVYTAHY